MLLPLFLLAACDRAGSGEEMEDAERSGLPGALAAAPLPSCPSAAQVQVVERARGLEVPWGMATLPDGRILVTERPGRIRVLAPELRPEPWADSLPVAALEEAGLMGIALHPDVASNGFVYVAGLVDRRHTQGWLRQQVNRVRARLGDASARPWVLRVWRLTDAEGRGTDPRVVVDAIVSNPLHAGGALLAPGADHLLLSVGDGFQPGWARDPSDPRGSVVRIPLDPATGLAPGGGGEATGRRLQVVATGVRNSQGMALGPEVPGDGAALFFMDHGPSGLETEGRRTGKDELNVLPPGALGGAGEPVNAQGPADFGWPLEAGLHETPAFLPPLAVWNPAVAPAGLAIRRADSGATSPRAELWVTGLRGEAVLRLEIERVPGSEGGLNLPATGAGWRVVCEERVTFPGGPPSRFRAVMVTEDGGVLVGTSNRDGRGVVTEGDDRILELRRGPEGGQTAAPGVPETLMR